VYPVVLFQYVYKTAFINQVLRIKQLVASLVTKYFYHMLKIINLQHS